MDNTTTLADALGDALLIILNSETLLTLSKSIVSKPFSVIEQTLFREILNPRLKQAITNYFSPLSIDVMPSPSPSLPLENNTSPLPTTTETHQLVVASSVEDGPKEADNPNDADQRDANGKSEDASSPTPSIKLGDNSAGNKSIAVYLVDGRSRITMTTGRNPPPPLRPSHKRAFLQKTYSWFSPLAYSAYYWARC